MEKPVNEGIVNAQERFHNAAGRVVPESHPDTHDKLHREHAAWHAAAEGILYKICGCIDRKRQAPALVTLNDGTQVKVGNIGWITDHGYALHYSPDLVRDPTAGWDTIDLHNVVNVEPYSGEKPPPAPVPGANL